MEKGKVSSLKNSLPIGGLDNVRMVPTEDVPSLVEEQRRQPNRDESPTDRKSVKSDMPTTETLTTKHERASINANNGVSPVTRKFAWPCSSATRTEPYTSS